MNFRIAFGGPRMAIEAAPIEHVMIPEVSPKRTNARTIGMPSKSNFNSVKRGKGIFRLASLNVQSRIAAMAPRSAVPAMKTLFLRM
jgi:hypothetical protein